MHEKNGINEIVLVAISLYKNNDIANNIKQVFSIIASPKAFCL